MIKKHRSVHRPNSSQINDIALHLGLNFDSIALESITDRVAEHLEHYDFIKSLPDKIPPIKYPRLPGYEVSPDNNPFGAWYYKTEINGTNHGPLYQKRIVLKDNICVAGVPMMNGSIALEGYVPNIDATVVELILNNGGTIIGKAHCESLCFSASSHTSDKAPVLNPYNTQYIAGGSSSGSAVLVAIGEADMSVGADQGGSIRIPSAFCGTYGMKPTYGLVPYTGIIPIDYSLDHAGPITKTVEDNALLLNVLAHNDGLDHRQKYFQKTNYLNALNHNIDQLKIGVIKESLSCDTRIRSAIHSSIDIFRKLGATVEEISIPEHILLAEPLFAVISVEGYYQTAMKSNGFSIGAKGLYVPSLMDFHSSWRNKSDDFSEPVKLSLILGEYLYRKYGNKFYAKAQNISNSLLEAYNKKFQKYDLLLLPTCPINAPLLEEVYESDKNFNYGSIDKKLVQNTDPFDLTGHPAMSIPCGKYADIPIGMMLVANHYSEFTIYQAANAFSQACDWENTIF